VTSEQSVIWFIANAIVIVAVLTIGTLGTADLLTRRGRAEQQASLRPEPARSDGPASRPRPATTATGHGTSHH
jgi:hypothetical protein